MENVKVDAKKIFDDALKLPEAEREEILARLIDSLGAPPGTRTEAGLTADIVRRAEEVEAGTVELVEWEVVRKRIEERLRKS